MRSDLKSKISFQRNKQKSKNNSVHSLNGNIKDINNIKLLNWNKGNSLFSNKLNDFQIVVDKYTPHIISLSEANYCNVTKMIFPEYNIEINDLGIGYSQSRVLLLIHKSLQYKDKGI